MVLGKIWKNLTGAKESSSASVATAKPLAPRAPRVRLLALHDIRFRLSQPSQQAVTIFNISVSGVGFERRSLTEWPAVGTVMEGRLELRSTVFPVRVKIAHISPSLVGGAFENPSPELVSGIQRYLDAELAAAEMLFVKPENLREDPDGTPYWFQGDNNCELYFVEADGKIVRFNLTVFGNYLEGGSSAPLKVGHLMPNGDRDAAGYKESSLIQWQQQPDRATLDLAGRFIQSLPNLSEVVRQEFFTCLGFKPF